MNLSRIILALTLSANALAGGSGSNGGGGLSKTSDNWVSAIPGLSIKDFVGPDYAEQIKDFREKHLNVDLGQCPNKGKKDGLLFPEFPAELQSKFRFHLSNGSDLKDLDLAGVCKSEKFTRGYGQFVMNLYRIKDQHNFITLMNAIQKLDPSPVHVVIEKAPEYISNIQEYTWFEGSTGRVHFAFNPACKDLISCCFGRHPGRLIAHELGHALMKRALGARYPEELMWHHPQTKDSEYLFGTEWMKNKTSMNAAYIEGIANVVEEDGYSTEHPYMETIRGNFMAIHNYFNKNNDPICYFAPFRVFRRSNGQLVAPLDNEVYLSSTLRAWIDSERIDEKFNIFMDYNHTRFEQLLGAITESRPATIVELGASLVRLDQSGAANAWYLEYFFNDLITGENLIQLLEPKQFPNSIGEKTQACLKKSSDFSRFFGSVREKEENEARTKSNWMRVESITDSALKEKIRILKNEFSKFVATAGETVERINEAETKLRESAYGQIKANLNFLDLCDAKSNAQKKYLNEIEVAIQKGYGMKREEFYLVPISPMDGMFHDACTGSRELEGWAYAGTLKDYYSEMLSLDLASTTPGTQAHYDRVTRFDSVNQKAMKRMLDTKEILYVNQSLQHVVEAVKAKQKK